MKVVLLVLPKKLRREEDGEKNMFSHSVSFVLLRSCSSSQRCKQKKPPSREVIILEPVFMGWLFSLLKRATKTVQDEF